MPRFPKIFKPSPTAPTQAPQTPTPDHAQSPGADAAKASPPLDEPVAAVAQPIQGEPRGAGQNPPAAAMPAPAETASPAAADHPPSAAASAPAEAAAAPDPAPVAGTDMPAEAAVAPVVDESGTGGEPLVVPVPDGTAVVEEPAVRARSYRQRAKLQRRLRYLRQTRELAFRDLGGFVFDQHRFGRSREDIVRAKIAGLDSIDRELRALELALDQHQELLVLQEPGISVCPRCGVIHGSDANFCPGCALPRGSGASLPLGARLPGEAYPHAPESEQSATAATAPPASGPAAPVAAPATDPYAADQPTTEFRALPPR